MAAERASARVAELENVERAYREIVDALRVLVGRLETNGIPQQAAPAPEPEEKPAPASALKSPSRSPRSHTSVPLRDGIPTGEQKVLDALASLEAVGVASPSKLQLSAFAGYSNPKSGGFAGPTAALLRKNLIRSAGGRAELTDAGRKSATIPERPASTKKLQERIFSMLGEGERKLLALLIAAHPGSMTRAELSARAGYSNPKSGGLAGPLARLLELGFAEPVGSGVVRGSEILFLKGKKQEQQQR